MRLITTIDLTRLSQALRAEGVHPDFVQSVELAAAVGSIRDDLLDALANLRLIEKFTSDDRSLAEMAEQSEAATIVGALFNNAIILYARATTPKGDRPKLLGTPKGRDMRALHEEILRLRNSAIAHFGRGAFLVDGPVYKEAVILNVLSTGEEQKMQVSVYTQRAANRANLSRQIANLIDRRLADVMERFEPLQLAVRNSLDNAIEQDPLLLSRLTDYQFDIDGFFATERLAEHHRQWVSSGGVSGQQTDATYTSEG